MRRDTLQTIVAISANTAVIAKLEGALLAHVVGYLHVVKVVAESEEMYV